MITSLKPDPAVTIRNGAFFIQRADGGVIAYLATNDNRRTNEFHFDPPVPLEVGTLFGAQSDAGEGGYTVQIYGREMTGATGLQAR